MNRTMLIGVVAGVGIAVAGGVAGFSLLGNSPTEDEQGTAAVDEAGAEATTAAAAPQATPQATPAPVAARAPAPAPAPRAAPAPQPAPEPEVECWDEEVVVQAEPKDEKKIAGTAAGALIGGALADKLGDDNDALTAAGAAAGALIGRKAQDKFQENRTTTRTERRCAPVGSR